MITTTKFMNTSNSPLVSKLTDGHVAIWTKGGRMHLEVPSSGRSEISLCKGGEGAFYDSPLWLLVINVVLLNCPCAHIRQPAQATNFSPAIPLDGSSSHSPHLLFLSEGRKGNFRWALKSCFLTFYSKPGCAEGVWGWQWLCSQFSKWEKGQGSQMICPSSFLQPLHMAEPGLEPVLSESRVHSCFNASSCLFEGRLWVGVHTFLYRSQDNEVGMGLLALKHDI